MSLADHRPDTQALRSTTDFITLTVTLFASLRGSLWRSVSSTFLFTGVDLWL